MDEHRGLTLTEISQAQKDSTTQYQLYVKQKSDSYKQKVEQWLPGTVCLVGGVEYDVILEKTQGFSQEEILLEIYSTA